MFRGDLSGYGSGLVGARLVLPNYKPRKRLLENFVTLIANFSHTFRKIYVIYIYIYPLFLQSTFKCNPACLWYKVSEGKDAAETPL